MIKLLRKKSVWKPSQNSLQTNRFTLHVKSWVPTNLKATFRRTPHRHTSKSHSYFKTTSNGGSILKERNACRAKKAKKRPKKSAICMEFHNIDCYETQVYLHTYSSICILEAKKRIMWCSLKRWFPKTIKPCLLKKTLKIFCTIFAPRLLSFGVVWRVRFWKKESLWWNKPSWSAVKNPWKAFVSCYNVLMFFKEHSHGILQLDFNVSRYVVLVPWMAMLFYLPRLFVTTSSIFIKSSSKSSKFKSIKSVSTSVFRHFGKSDFQRSGDADRKSRFYLSRNGFTPKSSLLLS